MVWAEPVDEIPDTYEQWKATELVAGQAGVYGYVVLDVDGTVLASINGTTPFITALADRVSDRAYVLIAMVGATALLSLAYWMEPTYALVLGAAITDELATLRQAVQALADTVRHHDTQLRRLARE